MVHASSLWYTPSVNEWYTPLVYGTPRQSMVHASSLWYTPSVNEWKERLYIWYSKIIAGVTASLWILGPRLFYYCLAVPVALAGEVIRPEKLYKCLALLFLMSHSLLGGVNLAVRCLAEGMPTMTRIKVRFYLHF
ncbi:hypothetical protein KUTeg_011850 [Tegillarca granosa]|uniref:Uncharacterized protein n=1 Tax=Tegillarca granosa TaxID=220873 RepID=A0ABQ9F1H5_TEGGR|nr:hypothetical protein KUTeg_011850 [Tegillarca granosa]